MDRYHSLVVFFAGGVIVGLELVGSRLLATYYGSSIYSWAAIISVTIISLAFGYIVGGVLSNRTTNHAILYPILFVSGASILSLPLISFTILKVTSSLGLEMGVLVSSFIIFGLPVFSMGIIPTFVAGITSKGEWAGRIGSIFALSSLGSFTGAIAMGYYILPILSLSKILYLFGFITIGLSLGGFLKNFESSRKSISGLISSLAASKDDQSRVDGRFSDRDNFLRPMAATAKNAPFALLLVFITGASVLVLEIGGAILLKPYFGIRLYVWTAMITITLVSLALGYFIGGLLSNRKAGWNRLFYIISLAGLASYFVELFTPRIIDFSDFLTLKWAALLSAGILFAIPITFLGMVVPYVTTLVAKDEEKEGITAGALFGASTIGSFAGSLLTGFYLIPQFDVYFTLYLNGLILIAITAFWFLSQIRFIPLSLLVLVLLLHPNPSVDVDSRVIYKTSSVYGDIKVVDHDGNRFLLTNGAMQACVTSAGTPCYLYPYVLGEITGLIEPKPQKTLMIGLGAGLTNRILAQQNMRVDSIEIDPKIVEVARQYFNYTGEVMVTSGRYYIKSDNDYDLIFLDAYSGYGMPAHLFTEEAFQEMSSSMKPDGVLAINTVGRIVGDNAKALESIFATLKQVFPHVYIVPIQPNSLDNVIFFASHRELPIRSYWFDLDAADSLVLTDNYNPLEYLNLGNAEEWRDDMNSFLGRELLMS